MRMRTKLARRAGDLIGWLCVVAAVALLSPGVRIVRAGDEPPMSVDPGLVEAARAQVAPGPAGSAVVRAEDVENALRPGASGIEVAPGVIVLNTRGYNYGPPPTPLAPEALKRESAPR